MQRSVAPIISTLALAVLLTACTSSVNASTGTGNNAGATETSTSTSTSASVAASGKPSDDDIKATIKRIFGATYGVDNGGAKFDHLDFTFGTIQVGGVTQKQIGAGEAARDVYPVKVEVDIDVHYSNNPTVQHAVRGTQPSDVFFFYKDTFGEWQFRTGSL